MNEYVYNCLIDSKVKHNEINSIIPKNYNNHDLQIRNSNDIKFNYLKELDHRYNEDKIYLYKSLVKNAEILENLKKQEI